MSFAQTLLWGSDWTGGSNIATPSGYTVVSLSRTRRALSAWPAYNDCRSDHCCGCDVVFEALAAPDKLP